MRNRGYGDVIYEVWRQGGDPDRVDYDDVRDDIRDGYTAQEIAYSELRRQERAHDRMIAGMLPDDPEAHDGQ